MAAVIRAWSTGRGVEKSQRMVLPGSARAPTPKAAAPSGKASAPETSASAKSAPAAPSSHAAEKKPGQRAAAK
jgi:hypothetical protein